MAQTEQIGASGPVRLVVGEASVVGQCIEGRQASRVRPRPVTLTGCWSRAPTALALKMLNRAPIPAGAPHPIGDPEAP